MITKLYQKTLDLASHKSSKKLLGIVSFIESSFFPIPPDIMIVPMVIAKKNDYLKIFLIATLFSTFGGIFGYFIGSSFLDMSMKIIEFYGYENNFINLKNNLNKGSGLFVWLTILFLAGFTPLPFKIFTITSGIIHYNLFIFFIICLISRGLRFFIVSYLSFKFGSTFDTFMKTKANNWFLTFGIFIVTIISFVYFILN